MTIDWLLIVVLLILVIFTMHSYRRGFVKSALSMTLFLITIFLTNVVNSHVTEFIMENTTMYEDIKEQCMEIYTPEKQQSISMAGSDEDIINSYPIAEILKEKIIKDNNPEIYKMLDVDKIEEYIAAYIAKTIISSASYVITFILVSIFLRMVMVALDIITKIPVLKEINQMVGAVLGLVQGLIIVWLLFIAADMLATTAFGISVQQQISGNIILKFISDNNIIWKFMM